MLTVSCDDKKKHKDNCPDWANAGRCTDSQYKKFMKRNCKKSCDNC